MNFFDILIILGIWITAAPAVILLYHRKKSPQSFEYVHPKTTVAIAAVLLCGTLFLLYGSFVEPRLIKITRVEIEGPHIIKPIKIAFVADYQVGQYKKTSWIKNTVEKIKQQQPDVVLIGGDMVDNIYYDTEEVHYLKPLEELAATYPVYAIHGNHEYGVGGQDARKNTKKRGADMSEHTKAYVESLGIHYLVNEIELIEIKNQSFYLFGGDSLWADKLDFSTLSDRKKDIFTIALVHNPSFVFETYPYDVHLYLSGHTHGGQIRLPFIGPLGRVDDILPAGYYKGLHALDPNTNLLVTAGIGESGTRARLWNPPEIMMITLK